MAEKFRDLTGGHGFVDEAGSIHKIDPKFLNDNKLVMKAEYNDDGDIIFKNEAGAEYTPDWNAIGNDIINNGWHDCAIDLFIADDETGVHEMYNLVRVDGWDEDNADSMTFMAAKVSDETPELYFIYARNHGASGWSVTLEKGVPDPKEPFGFERGYYNPATNEVKFYDENGDEYSPDFSYNGSDYRDSNFLTFVHLQVGEYGDDPNTAKHENYVLSYVKSGTPGLYNTKEMIFTSLVRDASDKLANTYLRVYKNDMGVMKIERVEVSGSSDAIEVVFPDGLWTEIKDANYDLNKFDVTLAKKDKTPIETIKYNDLLAAFKAGETIRIYPGDEFDSFYELEGKKGIKIYNADGDANEVYNGLYIHTPGADIMLCENKGRSSNYFRIISKSNDNGIGDIVLKSFRGAYGQLLFDNPDPDEGYALEWRDLPWDDIYEQWKAGKGVYILDEGVDRYRCDSMTCNEHQTADGTDRHCDSALFTLMNSKSHVSEHDDYSAKICVSTMQGYWEDYDEDLDYGGYMTGGEAFTRDDSYLFPRSYNTIYAEYNFDYDEYAIEIQSGIDPEVWSREFWGSVKVIDSVVLLNNDEWDGNLKCKILSYDEGNQTAILRGVYVYYDDTDSKYKEKEYNFLLDDYTITSISVE